MAKRGRPKKDSLTSSVSVGEKRMSAKDREEVLIENFVGLQKAVTNLSVKFEDLSDNIAKLLHILELSAKSFVDDDSSGNAKGNEVVSQKLNELIEQNRIIAKGMTILEEGIRTSANSNVPQDSNLEIEARRHKPLPRI
jgi:hypothetical protein